MKKVYKKKLTLLKPLLPILILAILAIPAFRDTLVSGYFPMHDDLQIMRQLVMDKCFHDGQIPCRWSVDLGYGYGYPIFNFYPPFPYYLGEIFRIINLPFTEIIKIIVVSNLLISGIFMYLLSKIFWGRAGGIISGLLYIYAPYHSVDIYVRGAFNEAWALVWFPAIFLFIYQLITTKKFVFVPLTALSVSFLLLSHNPMTMIFVPFALAWAIFWLIKSKNIKVVLPLTLSGAWGLCLAAFFTLPVLFEQQYAHVETLTEGYFNYLAHFATVKQLFISTFWGYGASVLGPNDGLSFQIGYIHWIAALLSLGIAWIYRKTKPTLSYLVLFLFFITLFYTFMNHEKSSFIWSAIPPLIYLQFPWRFLSISIFGTSLLAGSTICYFRLFNRDWLSRSLAATLCLAIILLNQGYFRWREHYPDMTDQDKFSGKSWQLLITASIFDYLPIWAPMPPANQANGDAELVSGDGLITTDFKNSTKQKYTIQMHKPSIFQINTFYFPGWVYWLDNQPVQINPKDDQELGRPRIYLTAGVHTVEADLTDTFIRSLGNILTLVGYLGIFIFTILTYLKRRAY